MIIYFVDLFYYLYDNTFFVLVCGLVFYYIIFKRPFKVIHIESASDGEIKNENDRRGTNLYCNDPKCVRCNLYRQVIIRANDRLSQIKADKSEIIMNITQSFRTSSFDYDSLTQNPNVFFYRELQSVPLWDKDIFDESRILEKHYDIIHSEFQKILSDKNKIGWKSNGTPTGSWEVFHLINQGSVVEENSRRCPETMSVISQMPSGMFKNVFGNVCFSVVSPSTVISEHYGPTNIRLRCHLGQLIIILIHSPPSPSLPLSLSLSLSLSPTSYQFTITF